MANSDTPRGFWPIRHMCGGMIRVTRYEVVNTNSNLLSKGDVAKILTTGYVDLAAATIGADAIGIFSHFEWVDASGEFHADTQMPATKTSFTKLYAFVWDDPYIVFGVQADSGTSLTIAAVGDCSDHVATAGNTTLKLSQHELDSDGLVGDGNSAQFKIIGKIYAPDNAWGEHVKLEVVFNEHHYKASGVAV